MQVNKLALAKEAIRIEQEVIGEAVGSQDQVFAAVGGLNRIDFSTDGPALSPLPIPTHRIRELLDSLLLVFIPGTQRIAARIEAEKIATIADHRLELRMLRALVEETHDLLVSNKDITELGDILDESWQIKRSLAPGVSNPALDDLYTAALRGGATGGKLVGAGGGGCYLFSVPRERRGALIEVLQRTDPAPVEIPLDIDRDGSRIVVYEPNSWH